MSKFIEETEDGKTKVTLDNKDKCDYMYNEICCNDQSEYLADYPDEHCAGCKLFKKERMKSKKPIISSLF